MKLSYFSLSLSTFSNPCMSVTWLLSLGSLKVSTRFTAHFLAMSSGVTLTNEKKPAFAPNVRVDSGLMYEQQLTELVVTVCGTYTGRMALAF